MSKFSAEKPKGDQWGIEDVIAEMTEKILAGEKSPLTPIIGVIDIKEVKVDPETGGHEAIVRIRRIESLTSLERIRAAQKMLLEQVAERRGEGTVLPFEEQDIIQRAFGGQPVGQQLQDDQEKEIDAELSDSDRLLRHIVAVHDYDPAVLTTEDAEARTEAYRWHDEQHELDPADRTFPDHSDEYDGWTRRDLADLLADSEEPELTTEEAVASFEDQGFTGSPPFDDGQPEDENEEN